MRGTSDVRKLALGIAGIIVIALLFTQWTQASSPATVALSFLIVVLLVAATARLWVAVTTSLAAMLAFNFFFLPPRRDPHDCGRGELDCAVRVPGHLAVRSAARVRAVLPRRGCQAAAIGHGDGLAIARGVLAVERGSISAENCSDGGARFTIVVPAEVK